MNSTIFSKSNSVITDQSCPACGNGKAVHLLELDAKKFYLGKLELVECLNCKTGFYLGEDPVVGYDYKGFEESYWMNYVQSGAGIDAMLQPLIALGTRAKGSLLDIGCGFGFVPHFWQTMGYGEAVGLESSYYGRKGKEILGVDIYHSYYNQCEEIKERKFDIVFSSEVIEHVRDPLAFINEIGQGLKKDGILVLTTPSVTCIKPETSETTLIATLSPGFHYFVLSKKALEEMLRNAGYTEVTVVDSGHRLFAWASKAPFPSPDFGNFNRDTYFKYLSELSSSNDGHVKCGALYRLLKDLLNTGRGNEAGDVYQLFSQSALNTYNIDFLNPELSETHRQLRKDLDNEQFPAWLGCGLLFAGIYRGNELGDTSGKVRLLRAAIDVMQREIEIGYQFAQEPYHFMPLARHTYQQALLELFERDISGASAITPSRISINTIKRLNETFKHDQVRSCWKKFLPFLH